MKRLAHVSLLLFFFAIGLAAMDQEPDEQEPLSPETFLPHHTFHQQQIILAIAAYQQSLYKSLGCCFKKNCAELFKTDKYRHVQIRIEQLNMTLCSVTSCASLSALAHRVLIIAHETRDAQSASGTIFKQQCLNTLQSLEHDLAEGEPDHITCTICLDGRKVVAASPCMHKISCSACYLKISETTQYCILCRQKIDDYLVIDEPCNACNKNSVTHIGECGHPRRCDDCLSRDKPISCSICGLASLKWLKVY